MNKEIIITAYENPDLDGTASAYAYAEFLNKIFDKKAIPAFFGKPHKEAMFVLKKIGFENFNKAEDLFSKEKKFILVDSSDLNGISEKISPDQVIEVIDHRKIHQAEVFNNAKIQIELVGAAATLVAEKFYQNNLDISESSAVLLYTAIISNTINFKAKITTDRDIKMTNWLKTKINIDDDFIHEMFVFKSQLDESLLQTMKNYLAFFNFFNKKIAIAQLEFVDLENFINNNLLEIKDCLEQIKKENNSDYCFLTAIDIEKGYNFFVALDEQTKNMLENIFDIKFTNDNYRREGIIMRKEIVPLLKNYLEK